MRKQKTKLLLTLSVATLSVLTMGVSTFAWFQAQAEVHVQTTTESTTITVSKPDDYVFYAYKGNTADHTLKNVFWVEGEGNCDFKEVTSSNLAAETVFNDLVPGKSYIYCVSASNLTGGRAISLTLDKFISNDNIKESYVNNPSHRYRFGTTTDINIGWAIDIYTTAVYTTTMPVVGDYSTFLTSTSLHNDDKFDYYYGHDSVLSGTGDANHVISHQVSLYSGSVTANMTKAFIFYRVYFTNNDVDTAKYYEVSSSSDETRFMGNRGLSYNTTDRYFKAFDDTNIGGYYLNIGSRVTSKQSGYSLCTLDGNHYTLKGVTLSDGETVKVYNNKTQPYGQTEASATADDDGTYTIDYYENNDTLTLTAASDSDNGYNANCYAGLTFALKEMTFTF